MSKLARIFLLVVAPLMAMLLALLGILTLPGNPTGWFLLLVGLVYIAGLAIVYVFRRQRFGESQADGAIVHDERGDRSFWLIATGMSAVFFLSPMEYLFLPAIILRNAWMSFFGLGLVISGTCLFVWARRSLGKQYSGHVSVKSGQALVQSGPYRLIRHPAYAGYLLMALGITLGYSSTAGLASVLALLLPGLVYRMKVEEMLLSEHFGEAYRQYMHRTKQLIPGIW